MVKLAEGVALLIVFPMRHGVGLIIHGTVLYFVARFFTNRVWCVLCLSTASFDWWLLYALSLLISFFILSHCDLSQRVDVVSLRGQSDGHCSLMYCGTVQSALIFLRQYAAPLSDSVTHGHSSIRYAVSPSRSTSIVFIAQTFPCRRCGLIPLLPQALLCMTYHRHCYYNIPRLRCMLPLPLLFPHPSSSR